MCEDALTVASLVYWFLVLKLLLFWEGEDGVIFFLLKLLKISKYLEPLY